MNYWEIITSAYSNYAGYFWRELTFQSSPWWHNYFFCLLLVSGFFFLLEIIRPWRKDQPKFRKDFWLDAFYMFFNFFLFWLIFYNAASSLIEAVFGDLAYSLTGINQFPQIHVSNLPIWSQFLLLFLIRDFIQWWTHRLLHRSNTLWEFHKVHHSVEEMGFAAHLRYHWMETVVYRSVEYIPLAMLGFVVKDFFLVYIFTLAWGHYNHSNISIDSRISGGIVGIIVGSIIIFSGAYSLTINGVILFGAVLFGIFVISRFVKYLFNSPEMHIWHHAYELPHERRFGVNFGLTLAIWDYIFGTAYIPHDGRDIKLGFPGVEEFPENFIQQQFNGISKK